MCTVSWVHTAEGYELFCNRDEQRTRPPAWPPRVRERCGIRFIAPIDGASGGSWIGVNQFGLTLCLLNRYEMAACAAPQNEYLSRGWLLLELLDSLSAPHVWERLRARRLTLFQPFTLAVVRPAEPAQLLQWNGCQLAREEQAEAHLPLTSSSYATASVVAARQQQFRQAQAVAPAPHPAWLDQFHRSHSPAPGAFSVCMHRAQAQTVSYSHIQVERRRATFRYFPQAPCAAAGILPYATRLELVTA